MTWYRLAGAALLTVAATVISNSAMSSQTVAAPSEIMNVSYDPTREFYKEVNAEFARDWKSRFGKTIAIRMSHGGSGKQARSVMDGLDADVVTLALAADIDALAERGKLLPTNWQKRLPNNSSPYTSTIVFLVHAGNPKKIRDWSDLVRPGISVITPNPKTSGGARWNYLAAWTWAAKAYDGDPAKVQNYMAKLFQNVPVLDTGARGSTTTFVNRGMGDVLIAWENEAHLVLEHNTGKGFEIIMPSLSILTEPPVAIVDKIVDRRGTRKQTQAYLEFLYSPRGQVLAAKHHFRPSRPDSVPVAMLQQFPRVEMVTVNSAFGGWSQAQKLHFSEGGTFDRIYQAGK